ncbi:MAG: nuclear transport factor 2 family protein [Myxococcota bacterium]
MASRKKTQKKSTTSRNTKSRPSARTRAAGGASSRSTTARAKTGRAKTSSAKTENTKATRSNPSSKGRTGTSASPARLAALEREVQRLADLEACRRLRVTYFRCLDTANLKDMKEILTEDFSCYCAGGDYVYQAKSRAEFLEVTENSFHTEIVTQHNGHGAEVELLSDTQATALVYFNDLVYHFRSKEFLMGTGLYKDRYRKDPDGVWRIEYGEYERIYEITEILDRAPHFTAHYLAKHGKQLPAAARYDAATGRYV